MRESCVGHRAGMTASPQHWPRPKRSNPKSNNKFSQWKSPILSVLLEELVAVERPQHLEDPKGGYFRWEVRKAERLNVRWAEARLNGLVGDDACVIRWIRLSGGQTPCNAADLACGGITPEEAGLSIGRGGRIDGRLPSIFSCPAFLIVFNKGPSIDRKPSRWCGNSARCSTPSERKHLFGRTMRDAAFDTSTNHELKLAQTSCPYR